MKRLYDFWKRLLMRIGILTLSAVFLKGKAQFSDVKCLITVAVVIGIVDILINLVISIATREMTATKLLVSLGIIFLSGFIELFVAKEIVVGFAVDGVLPFIFLAIAVSSFWYQFNVSKSPVEELENNENEE